LGKTQQWVAYRLRFGRFLEFTTTVVNIKSPRNLTEGRFRSYWESTAKGDERHRFRAVLKAMEEDFVEPTRKGCGYLPHPWRTTGNARVKAGPAQAEDAETSLGQAPQI
jgi:hypothetical protein